MDELLEQLARENPVTTVTPPTIAIVWARVDTTPDTLNPPGALRHARAALGALARSRARSRFGVLRAGLGLAAAVAVAVVAVVVVIVVVLAAHRKPPSAPTSHRATSAGLTAELAILRRPQDAADRAMQKILDRPLGAPGLGTVDRGLTRLVARVASGRLGPVYIYVVVQPPIRRTSMTGPSANSRYVAAVQLTSADRGGGWNVGLTAADLRHVYPGWPGWGHYAVLVPDGVARVRWTFRPDTFRDRSIRPFTVTAVVHHNVAIARVPENSHGGVLVSPTTTTWYDNTNHPIGTWHRRPTRTREAPR